MRRFFLVLARFVIPPCCLATPLAYGATFYVAETGTYSGDGTQARPWPTPQYAANRVRAGDSVIILDGKYLPFRIDRGGSPEKPIVFKAANRHGAYVEGSSKEGGRNAGIHVLADYIVIDGFRVTGTGKIGVGERGIRVSGAHNDVRQGNMVRNCLVRNAGWNGITTSFAEGVVIEYNDVADTQEQHGIYVANSADNPVIRGNTLHKNRMAGLHMNGDLSIGGDGEIRNALIEGNVIHNNGHGSSAINMDGVTNSTVRNNLLYNNANQGIACFKGDGATASYNNKIVNNTVIMPPGSSHALRFKHGSTGGFVRNNVLIHLGDGDSIGIDSLSVKGFSSDYNVVGRFEDAGTMIGLTEWRKRFGQDTHSIQADMRALFVDPRLQGKADFSLKPTATAVDAGIPLTEVSNDIRGVPRPQGRGYDIGAYEHAKEPLPSPRQ